MQMRASIFLVISLLLPLASSATIHSGLNLAPNATTLFNAPEYVPSPATCNKRPLMVLRVSFNVSMSSPPEPYSKSFEDIFIVLSEYGRPIPPSCFFGMYVGCLWKIWKVVAHSQNAYQPPEVRPLDGRWFIYKNDRYYLELQQSSSAVVAWKYVEIYYALNIIAHFADEYGMREMNVEVVAGGTGGFGGTIKYIGALEALE